MGGHGGKGQQTVDEGEAEALFDAFLDEEDGVEISAALGDWGSWDADSFDERVDERVDCP